MIGVFDSGVGGLTVVKEIFKYLPGYQIIYFGDTARLPYGTKGADFVKRYSKKITKWLLDRGAKVIVVACNTSSAWASDFLRKEFKNVPIFEMITPVAKEIMNARRETKGTKVKKIGIIGTPGTIKSGAYQKKLVKFRPLRIYTSACPLFVPLVEEGWVDNEIVKGVAKKYLIHLKEKKINTLILACTHYPLLKKTIKEIIGANVKIINPAENLAKELKSFFDKNPFIVRQIKRGNNHQFFFSDEPYNFQKISHLCFNKKIKPIIKDPFI